MAKQAVKSTRKKKAKASPKKKPAAGKAPRQAAASRPPERRKNAVYVLIIMGLVTAMAVLFGKFYMPQKSVVEKLRVAKPVSEKPENNKKEEKQEKKKEAEEKEKVAERRPEREEKTKNQAQTEIKEPAEKKQAESVRVYFVALNEKTDKMYLTPVSRKVGSEPLLENTLRELVKGPTAAEKKKGLLTAVPPGLKINSVKIRNKTAVIDFNSAIEYGAAGSILINRIDQIVYTATQFGNVGSVIIKINGKTKQTLGADGLSISGPLHRRQ